MNKKISLGLALSLIAVSMAVTFILTSFFSLQSFNKKVVDVTEKSKKYTSLQTLDGYIRENYYGDIDESKLSDGLMKGYVSGIGDKYSRYLTAAEYLTEKNENSGELVGLGLTLAEDASGYMRISEIMEESPAFDSGLTGGDIITADRPPRGQGAGILVRAPLYRGQDRQGGNARQSDRLHQDYRLQGKHPSAVHRRAREVDYKRR